MGLDCCVQVDWCPLHAGHRSHEDTKKEIFWYLNGWTAETSCPCHSLLNCSHTIILRLGGTEPILWSRSRSNVHPSSRVKRLGEYLRRINEAAPCSHGAPHYCSFSSICHPSAVDFFSYIQVSFMTVVTFFLPTVINLIIQHAVLLWLCLWDIPN